MNINGTTLIAIVTAPLIIGSLLGAPYQTRPNPRAPRPKAPASTHSNYIRIEIRPGTKVAVVAPQIGDTVEWYPQATKANPNPLPAVVTFQGKPPCEQHYAGDPISACVVNAKGNFEYDCDSVKNPCVDPGMDPRSQTGTVLLAMPAPSGGGAPPPPPSVRAPALALANGPPALPTMTIDCDQTQTPIVPQGKNPLAAYQSQQISWVAGAVSDFIINIPPKFCMEDTTGTGHIQADNVAVCTVAADADTTKPAYYSVSGVCPGNKTGNFTINVAKWPPTK